MSIYCSSSDLIIDSSTVFLKYEITCSGSLLAVIAVPETMRFAPAYKNDKLA